VKPRPRWWSMNVLLLQLLPLGDVDSWINKLIGNSSLLIQISAVGMILALFVIWWRR
jgi:hypothetical protein